MPGIKFERLDFPLLITPRSGDTSASIAFGASGASATVALSDPGLFSWSLRSELSNELTNWRQAVFDRLPSAVVNNTLFRVALDIRDAELASFPWEDALRPLLPASFSPIAIVRISRMRPRSEMIPFTLPFRLLQIGGSHARDVGAMVSGVFGNHPREAVERAMLTTRISVSDLGDLQLDSSWPTVDVLHLDNFDLPQNEAFSRSHPDKLFTLGWFLRFTDRYQTRLVVIDCKGYSQGNNVRRLAAKLIACGGPAVLVVDLPEAEGNSFYQDFYRQFIHDAPLDVILADRMVRSLEHQPALFVGAGREEALRASNVGLGLTDMAGNVSSEEPGSLLATGKLIVTKVILTQAGPIGPYEEPIMTPGRVLIMRHAGRPADRGDIHLSAAGVRRAQRLATYIPQTFGAPRFLFAAKKSPDSNRPVETIQPLSEAINVPIDNTFANDEYKELADCLLTDPKYRGALVLVCWHHEKIPKLALRLGAPASSIPDPWDPAVFNLIITLDYYSQPAPATASPIIAELQQMKRAWPSIRFDVHEGDGLIPVATTLSKLRDLWSTERTETQVLPPKERFINSSLWEETTDGTLTKLDRAKTVAIGEVYHLGIEIGPLEMAAAAARAQPLIEEVFAWTPHMEGVWVEVGVTGLDFEVLGDPVQELWLPREGASALIRFAIVPRTGRTPILRFCLYYRNNVLQSFRLAARTGVSRPGDLARALDISNEEVGDRSYLARLEYSLLDDFGSVPNKPARAVSIVANDLNGRPAITVKGEDLFDVRIDNDLPKYVTAVRQALLDISRQPVLGTDPGYWPYRFQGPSDLMRNKSTPQILEAALPAIAEPGWDLYTQVISARQRNRLTTVLETERQLIHVAHVIRENVIPWGAVYDRKYDSRATLDENGKAVTHAVCLAAIPDENGRLPATKCGVLRNCLLHQEQLRDRIAKGQPGLLPETVVCPLHFWGFKHVIEIPPQQISDSNQLGHSQLERVRAGKVAQLAAGINAKLFLAQEHSQQLTEIEAHPGFGAAFAAQESQRDRILAALRRLDLDFIYLYCHARGGQSDPGVFPPYLEFQGVAEVIPGKITSADFDYDQGWAHGPLVFLNGCGTVGSSPDALSPFIKALVDDRGASGIIGTEVPVWEQLASEVAIRFLKGFLSNQEVGQVLLDVRRALLSQYNPLGLVYTLYAAAHLKLERAVADPSLISSGQ